MVPATAFHAPESVTEVVKMADELGEDAKLVAGGVAVVNLLRLGFIQPKHLISLHRLRELRDLRLVSSCTLEIGALATHRALELSPTVRSAAPVLSELESTLAGVQVRNRGTVGGSVAHADPRGDLAPGLLVLGASFNIASIGGARVLAADEFFKGYFETALQDGELLTRIDVPISTESVGTAFIKLWARSPSDFGVMNVACLVEIADGCCKRARIGLGGVHDHAYRPSEAEACLIGGDLSEGDLLKAADAAAESSRPVSDLRGSADYKREMVRVVLPRALRAAAARAQEDRAT